MIAIDTNVLLRFFQQDDDPAQSARAHRAVRDNAPVFVNDIVLVEFAWTCKAVFKLDRAAIRLRLEAISDAPEFTVARPEALSRAIWGYGAQKSDFPDWLIGQTNAEHGCEATLTFDKGAKSGAGFTLVAG